MKFLAEKYNCIADDLLINDIQIDQTDWYHILELFKKQTLNHARPFPYGSMPTTALIALSCCRQLYTYMQLNCDLPLGTIKGSIFLMYVHCLYFSFLVEFYIYTLSICTYFDMMKFIQKKVTWVSCFYNKMGIMK